MQPMPNIANALKAEIARVARKEIRGEISPLQKLSSQHRSHIASLRRKVEELERALKRAKTTAKAQPEGEDEEGAALRFRASGLASHRKRLELSAADFGRLLGVSGQTVYKWEQGTTKPRRSQLESIAAARKMGKKEALRHLGR
jgi:DNA-binding transcriptional regulator YiaG